MKQTLGLASAVLMAVSLTACSSSSDDYCQTLKDSQTQFSNLNFTSLSEDQFTELRGKVGALEAQAPSNVQDDWAVVGDKLDQFKGLLEDAGIGLDDIATLQQGKLPPGVDPNALKAVVPKIQALLQDSSLTDAKQAIQANAKSECNITLGS